MPDPRLLRAFLAVAAGLSFRQAARDLHYAPSSVSAQIRALEEELGATLFVRDGRSVTLTEPGRRLLAHARRLADLEAQTRRVVSGADDDPAELTVRVSETLGCHCLPRLLPPWRARHPATRLRLATQSRHGLARDLRHGLTDLGLILGEPFAADGVTVEVLRHEPLAVIAPPDSPLAGRGAVGPRDLDGATLLLTPHVWSARRRIETGLLAAGGTPATLIECGSVAIVTRCVMAGLGLSVTPRFAVAEAVAAGRLAALDWAPERLAAPVLLAFATGRETSAPAATLTAAIRAFFAADRPRGEGGREGAS